jgi:hypothetical protein
VANTILKRKTGNDQAKIVAMTIPMKMPKFVKDDFQIMLGTTLSLFVLLMYIPAIYRTVYRIVQEKETRAKESMRMMGLQDMPYWASWFIYYLIVNTCLTTLSWFFMFGIFKHTSYAMLWVFFFSYGLS